MKRRRAGGFGDDSGGDDAEPANAARLEVVRLEQAARARPRGLDAASLSTAAAAAGGAGAADNLLSVPAARSSAAAPAAAGKSEFGRGFAAAGSAADVAEGDDPQLAAVRLGGMVQAGSIRRAPDGVTVHFVVGDGDALGIERQ